MPFPYSPTSQSLQSPWLGTSFVFTNTSIRNQSHNKFQPVKLLVFATESLSTVQKQLRTLSFYSLCSNFGKQNGFSIREGQESLDFKEIPHGLQAQKFMDAIKDKTDIFSCIKRDGRNWTISDFNDLLMALVTANELEIALKLYSEIPSYGLAPDSWTFSIMLSYSTLLYGLLRWGETRAALITFKEMVDFGIEVDERMMNTLLRGLCMKSWEEKDLLEDAYQVFEKMNFIMDPGTYGMVIRALCVGKKTDEALIHLQHMVRRGYVPRTITFNNVIQAFCHEGKVDDALLVVLLMNEHGKIPSRTSYDILIKKLNQQERSSGACIVYGAALKQGVLPHRVP
ncbi:hypothetical protein Pint_35068 [Pistacia integerrima]|uniref:Uncharacterized protein n=1 Tax=Pistacia integerrima TaxID=434235 RepID=A0ACC0Y2W2_9ROSI|nr:hypothetical protein Pint_35068 [Pistacia integerrima]